jgi:hypothetical protein
MVDHNEIADTLNEFYNDRGHYEAIAGEQWIDIHTEFHTPFARGVTRMILEDHNAVPIKVTHTSDMRSVSFEGYRVFFGEVEADLGGFSLR